MKSASVAASYDVSSTSKTAGADDSAWLRRVDALDLSLPTSSRLQSQLTRNFFQDSLTLAQRDFDLKSSEPRTPQLKRRRWAARDLRLDDDPTTSGEVNDEPWTVLDVDPDNWTDDEDTPVSPGHRDVGHDWGAVRSNSIGYQSYIGETRPYQYRAGGCRSGSRLAAPNTLPMILEDEQNSSADDEQTVSCQSTRSAGVKMSWCEEINEGLKSLLVRDRLTASPPPAVDRDTSTCRQGIHGICPLATPTSSDRQPAVPTCTSPSLLDQMHKKYCSSQYTRRLTPTPKCCQGNAHLLGPATNHNFVTEIVGAVPGVGLVTGSHVTSPRHLVVVTSSTLGNVRLEDGGDNSGENDEHLTDGHLNDDQQRNGNLADDNDHPWKKRFCEHCDSELEVGYRLRCSLVAYYLLHIWDGFYVGW